MRCFRRTKGIANKHVLQHGLGNKRYFLGKWRFYLGKTKPASSTDRLIWCE